MRIPTSRRSGFREKGLQGSDSPAIMACMKLLIDDFALIRHAEIDIDGITVIAGNNNSGKSTVGKILFSLFTALNNIDEKIKDQRLKMIQRTVLSKLDRASGADSVFLLWKLENEVRNFISNQEDKVCIDWPALVQHYERAVPELVRGNTLEEMKQAVDQIETWPRLRLIGDAINPYFSSCFNQQINSLSSPEVPAKVSMHIKKEEISITFEHNYATEINPGIELKNKAIFYSSPLAVDLMGGRVIDNPSMKHLSGMLMDYSDRMVDDSDLLEKSMLKDRLSRIMEKIDTVLPGRILKQRDGYKLSRPEWKEPLSIKNLSMGLKAFVVLKMLLESNQLKDRDVLILDEPEIHLHPTWQLVYAEVIVLLQKEFDLSVVVTTHSHFFLNALETYSRKHSTFDKLKLYLTELGEDGANIQDVTDDSEQIYKRMAEAVDTLTSERLSCE